MYKKLLYILLSILMLIILPGCWDNVEIDERAFITGIGFDKYENDKGGNNQENENNIEEISEIKKYVLTITYPNVGLIAGKDEGDPSFTYTTVAASPSDGKQQLTLRSNKNIFFGHSKILVIGEEAAKDEDMMREILDAIHRSVHINRKIHVFVAKDTAKNILTMDSGKNMDISLFIEELMEKETKSSRRPVDKTFEHILIDIRENEGAIIPRVFKGTEEVGIGGAAVLKKYALCGWLSPLEVRDINMLKEKVRRINFTMNVEGNDIAIEQVTSDSKMKVEEGKEGNLIIKFDIRFEGVMLQHYLGVPDLPMDAAYLDELDKKIGDAIEGEMKKTFEKMQKEMQVDVFGIKEHLRRYEPDIYEKIKNNWDEAYQNAKVEINVDLHIRRVGIEG